MKFEYAKIQFGPHVQKCVKTHSGAPVVLLGITRLSSRDVIVGVLNPDTPAATLHTWEIDGSCGCQEFNLLMVRPKVRLCGTVFVGRDGLVTHQCPKRPDLFAVVDLGELNIEIEEGKGRPW